VSTPPDWVPQLVTLNDHGGDWNVYIEIIYGFFKQDMLASRPSLDRKLVVSRRDPIYGGKEAGFWHCTSEGKVEDDRLPDLRRCERIRWLRAIIEHCDDTRVDRWTTDKRGGDRHYLWFNEEYLISLGVRKKYWQLITAFCTEREHTRKKLR